VKPDEPLKAREISTPDSHKLERRMVLQHLWIEISNIAAAQNRETPDIDSG
jgi:hypothetical protein